MAQMVYYSLLERTAALQLEVAQMIIISQFFGEDALPVGSAYRSNLGVLSRQREDPHRIRMDLNKRVQDNIAVIEEFERLFAEAEDADIKAFAEAMAAKWKGSDRDERGTSAEKGSKEPA